MSVDSRHSECQDPVLTRLGKEGEPSVSPQLLFHSHPKSRDPSCGDRQLGFFEALTFNF